MERLFADQLAAISQTLHRPDRRPSAPPHPAPLFMPHRSLRPSAAALAVDRKRSPHPHPHLSRTPKSSTAPSGPIQTKVSQDLTRLSSSSTSPPSSPNTRPKPPNSKSPHPDHRPQAQLADPRAVAGFRPQWKEMVYPLLTDRAKRLAPLGRRRQRVHRHRQRLRLHHVRPLPRFRCPEAAASPARARRRHRAPDSPLPPRSRRPHLPSSPATSASPSAIRAPKPSWPPSA